VVGRVSKPATDFTGRGARGAAALRPFDCDVPLELIEELIAEAKRRLPPTT